MTASIDFYDGRSARRQRVVLRLDGDRLCLDGEAVSRSYPIDACRLDEPLGGAPRVLTLPDGGHCEIPRTGGGADLLALLGARLGTRDGASGAVARLQRRWTVALASLVVTVAALAAAYQWGLPWAAGIVAPRIPAALTQHISDAALSTLDRTLLKPSALPEERQQALRSRMAAVLGPPQGGAGRPAYALHFRQGPMPNAFALPSGDVVVFDSLVKLAGSDDEVVAVMAHELGHVAYRHGLRQLLQSSVVAYAVGLYLGDVSSLASGMAALVLESRYSRDFESEADRYAADRLRQAGLSPELLGQMLARLDRGQPGHDGHGSRDAVPGGDLLASHPDTQARIEALRRLTPERP